MSHLYQVTLEIFCSNTLTLLRNGAWPRLYNSHIRTPSDQISDCVVKTIVRNVSGANQRIAKNESYLNESYLIMTHLFLNHFR